MLRNRAVTARERPAEWQAKNVSGGASRGSNYIGRLEGALDLDLAKLAGWQGQSFHVNGNHIQGTRPSRDHIANHLMTASFIEALPTTRHSGLWLEQKILGDQLGVVAMGGDVELGPRRQLSQADNSSTARSAGRHHGGQSAERRAGLSVLHAMHQGQARAR